MKRPTRIGSIVAGDPTLSAIIRRAHEFQALEELVRSWLPPALAPHVGVANIRDDTLVLTVKSAVWATRLRYECPAILEAARRCEATRTVTDVKIRMLVDGNAV